MLVNIEKQSSNKRTVFYNVSINGITFVGRNMGCHQFGIVEPDPHSLL
jgi:hypothetical protein